MPNGYDELAFRHLPASIAFKKLFVSVNLTVKFAWRSQEARSFKELDMQETIEWESSPNVGTQ
jgi:hypothetical protein